MWRRPDGHRTRPARPRGLLVVAADEDDHSSANRIPMLIAGAGVKAGQHGQRYTLYSLLRLLEDMYGLPRLAHSADAVPITGVWG